MINEISKILTDSIQIECTCVRVPVMRSHSMAIYLECEKNIDLARCSDLIDKFDGVVVTDNKDRNKYPCPLDVSGMNIIKVGRMKKSINNSKGISIWSCGDQICKGAATNAVQIACYYISKFNEVK